MSKNEDQIKITQDMQLTVRKSVSAFSVTNVDWERLRRMITNDAPSYVVWENVRSAGFSSALAIFLTWLTVFQNVAYPYSAHLLTAVFVTLTIGVMAAIFARNKKKDQAYSKKQILDEMDTMQVSIVQEVEELLPQIQIPGKFTILKATYGVPGHNVDVTQALTSRVTDNHLDMMATNAIAGDPAPGTPKVLEIEYEESGIKKTKKYNESEQVILP